MATEFGKHTFPTYESARERIAARLLKIEEATPKVPAQAVCRKIVAPQISSETAQNGGKGSVVAEFRVENGSVAEIFSLSGPSAYQPAVTQALKQLTCDKLDRSVTATYTFEF